MRQRPQTPVIASSLKPAVMFCLVLLVAIIAKAGAAQEVSEHRRGITGRRGCGKPWARSDGADFRRAARGGCLVTVGLVRACCRSSSPSDEPLHSLPVQWREIQSALDNAYAAGGGTVYAAPGVYCVDNPLIVRSRIYLVGAGVGATVIRGKAGGYAGTIIDGAAIYATIAAVAADGASISDLTVDQATNITQANGIALIPDGVNYSGTPSSTALWRTSRFLGLGTFIHTRYGTCGGCITRS